MSKQSSRACECHITLFNGVGANDMVILHVIKCVKSAITLVRCKLMHHGSRTFLGYYCSFIMDISYKMNNFQHQFCSHHFFFK